LFFDEASFFIEQCLVEGDELKERFGSGVVVSPFELSELFVGGIDRQMCLCHIDGYLLSQLN